MFEKYWYTGEEKGLTHEEINAKCEELWIVENTKIQKTCYDCGVSSGKQHDINCDVARCINCKQQALMCSCSNTENDKWSGLWPGIKQCYELKLLTWSDPNRIGGTGWTFDLNTLALLNAKK